jgi:hypothetical protein
MLEDILAAGRPVHLDIFEQMLTGAVARFREGATAWTDDCCAVPEVAAAVAVGSCAGEAVAVELPEEAFGFLGGDSMAAAGLDIFGDGGLGGGRGVCVRANHLYVKGGRGGGSGH